MTTFELITIPDKKVVIAVDAFLYSWITRYSEICEL
jgi:hypothetical protein